MEERDVRRITEPQALRALSHPTRMSIIDILGVEGSATATRCAELTGESVASCSYHLGMLAKYGFVVPAEGGQGREKPWRLEERSHSWDVTELDDEGQLAADALDDVFVDHSAEALKRSLRAVTREPEGWQTATGVSSAVLYLTAEEAAALRLELQEIGFRFRERRDHPEQRPPDARPVRVFLARWLARPIDQEGTSS